MADELAALQQLRQKQLFRNRHGAGQEARLLAVLFQQLWRQNHVAHPKGWRDGSRKGVQVDHPIRRQGKERILRLCAERDISINKLATISALPPSSVKNILYGRSSDPKILTIKKICDGLDITLGEFFSTPEFDALEQEIK